jgi:hypothetical protein
MTFMKCGFVPGGLALAASLASGAVAPPNYLPEARSTICAMPLETTTLAQFG